MDNLVLLIWMASLIAIIVYIVKWFRHRKDIRIRRRAQKRLLISVVVMVVSFIGFGVMESGSDSNKNSSSDEAKAVTTKRTKYIGKDKYSIAKKENVALVAKKKKLAKQEDKLQSQRDEIESQEAAAKQKAEEQQATAKKQQEEQAKEAQKQQEKAQQEETQQQQAQQQSQQEQTQTQDSNAQQNGDMNTSDSGTIVGNSKSHIYHVPGQRGYNMNSSNAVYFKTEQDAINAGYRRSKV